MVAVKQGYRAPVVFGASVAAAPSSQNELAFDVDEERLKARYACCHNRF